MSLSKILGSLNKARPAEREQVIHLTNIFLDSVIQAAHSFSSDTVIDLDKKYQIRVGNMHIGALNGRHLFMRIAQEERIICDFHGICHVVGESKELHIAIEPGDYDYFTHLKPDEHETAWEGNAKDLGFKLRRCVWAADLINANPDRYGLLTDNCNRILNTLLCVADIEKPKNPRGWTPGYGRLDDDVIAEAIAKADMSDLCPGIWFQGFMHHVAEQVELFKQHGLVGAVGEKLDINLK